MIVSKFRQCALFFLIIFSFFCQGCADRPPELNSSTKPEVPAQTITPEPSVKSIAPGTEHSRKIKISEDQEIPRDPQPIVEKVGNFKSRTEYFTLSSKRFPDAVSAVSLPEDYDKNPNSRYPMVIAFGGAGECSRPPRDGALAWVSYYKADEAVRALGHNKLSAVDFRNLVTQEQLDAFNRKLRKAPYKGVILVCPYSPLLRGASGLDIPEYEDYIMKELIPALQKHYRVDASRIGVDGVSMGGARSMYYGFKYPETFRRIGSVQAAVAPFMDVYSRLIEANREKIRKCSIQVVSSDGDVFLKSVEKFSAMLDAKKVPNSLLILKGPHDYIFNQGPGSLALLAFHGSNAKNPAQGPIR